MLENMDEKEYMSTSEDEEDAKDMITLSGDFAEKIWVPDTFFANDKNRFESSPLHIEQLTNSFFYSSSPKAFYTMSPSEINLCD